MIIKFTLNFTTPHAPAFPNSHNVPFELIHTYLWGPPPSPSFYGYSYYIVLLILVPNSLGHTIYKSKYEFPNAFKLLFTLVKTQFCTTIKSIQFDMDGEYRPFTKF